MKPAHHKPSRPHLKRAKMSVEGKTAFPRSGGQQAFNDPESMGSPAQAFAGAVPAGASPSEAQG